MSLLTPELLSAVGRLVVESGHKVAKKKPGEPLRGRCDSFVVETDVHYPTDVSLLSTRCLLRETGRAAEKYAVGGWPVAPSVPRGQETVQQGALDAAGAAASGAGGGVCGALPGAGGAGGDNAHALRDQGVGELRCRSITGLVAHARRQIDQVERRLLRGETIPHEEKVFSILGHRRGFRAPGSGFQGYRGSVLHHKVRGRGCGRGSAMVQEAQAPVRFDRGFHSRGGSACDVNALPGKGYLSKADREREEEERAACASGGVCDRVRTWCGGLRGRLPSVLNLHRIGDPDGSANDNDNDSSPDRLGDSEPTRDGTVLLSLETGRVLAFAIPQPVRRLRRGRVVPKSSGCHELAQISARNGGRARRSRLASRVSSLSAGQAPLRTCDCESSSAGGRRQHVSGASALRAD